MNFTRNFTAEFVAPLVVQLQETSTWLQLPAPDLLRLPAPENGTTPAPQTQPPGKPLENKTKTSRKWTDEELYWLLGNPGFY